MEPDLTVPAQAVAELFSRGNSCILTPALHGAINKTYFVAENPEAEPHAVLQQMHPLLGPALIEDMAAITSHLQSKNFPAPRLLPARDGRNYLEHSGARWRMMTYLPGITHSHIESSAEATSAGALIGRFHTALQDFPHPLQQVLPHFHATQYILSRLETVAERHKTEKKYAELRPLIAAIRGHREGLADDASLPRRLIHGDLKVSNIRFDAAGNAQAVLDFDTCMRHTLMVEMGDALRSWSMDGDEDAHHPTFHTHRS